MSADRDLTRLLDVWIKEDAPSPSDRVVESVLDQITRTRQRGPLGPAERFRRMNTPIRVAVTAAAIAVVAVTGLNLLPSGGDRGALAPTMDVPTHAPATAPATSTPKASASLEAGASIPTVISGPTSGPGSTEVKPGTYRLRGPGSDPAGWPRAVMVTIPDQWWARSALRGAGLVRGEHEGVALATFDVSSVGELLADPCDDSLPYGESVEPPIGPSVDDLVAGLTSRPGLAFAEPVDITVDGWSGVRLEVTPPSRCGRATLWLAHSYEERWSRAVPEGWRGLIDVVDVNGLRLVVLSAYDPDAPADVPLELQRMVDSIDIEP